MTELTRESLLAMKPGRELDALVAEKVMGWEWRVMRSCRVLRHDKHGAGVGVYDDQPTDYWDTLPHYSTNIAASFEVQRKAHVVGEHGADELVYRFYELLEINEDETWYDGPLLMNSGFWKMIDASPEIRCKAALLAVLGL